MNMDFFFHEPAEEYHLQSRNGCCMSSHLLADFRDSPLLYYKKTNGKIDDKTSSALAFGRAAHSLILEGRQAFEKDFLVSDGPINPRTGEPYGHSTKAYTEWLSSLDREVVSGRDYGLMLNLRRGVTMNGEAAELLSEGEAEGVVRTSYREVLCQIRMDWFNPELGLVDLKTCESLKWFESDCHRYGYVYQLAFYRAIIREVTGITVPVHIIAVEKSEPFAAGVWKLTPEILDYAEEINKDALMRYLFCCTSNEWPTGYEDIRIIDKI